MNFRIPEWAEGASVFVNGTRQQGLAIPGHFAAIHREWKTGDRIELELPLKMRLETIDAQHTDTVALLRGPLVLMAVKQQQDSPVPASRGQPIACGKTHRRTSVAGGFHNRPRYHAALYLDRGLPYTTYLKVV